MDALAQAELVTSWLRTSDAREALGQLDEALRCVHTAVTLGDALSARDPANSIWLRIQGEALWRLGFLLDLDGRPEEAGGPAAQAVDLLDRAVRRDPAAMEERLLLAHARSTRARVEQHRGRLDAAAEHFRAAVADWQQLADRGGYRIQVQTGLAEALSARVLLELSRGDLPAAEGTVRELRPLLDRLADEVSASVRLARAGVLEVMGEVCRVGGVGPPPSTVTKRRYGWSESWRWD